jgi:hypothetical protein
MDTTIRSQFNSISNAIKKYTKQSDSILIPLYKELYKQVMAELKHNNLMSEIRGERWVIYEKCCSQHGECHCLNCYAYQDIKEINGVLGIEGVFCLNHLHDFENNINAYSNIKIKRLSYLEFIKECCFICPTSIFTYDRPGILINSHESCYKGSISNFDNKFINIFD